MVGLRNQGGDGGFWKVKFVDEGVRMCDRGPGEVAHGKHGAFCRELTNRNEDHS